MSREKRPSERLIDKRLRAWRRDPQTEANYGGLFGVSHHGWWGHSTEVREELRHRFSRAEIVKRDPDPTPDQPEQERAELWATLSTDLLHATRSCCHGGGYRHQVKDHHDPRYFDNPRFRPCPEVGIEPSPSLLQRIEGLIAEFEERAESFQAQTAGNSIEAAICRNHASRLRAVLKADE